MITYNILDERIVIKIEGEDRFKFLQGLITNDIYKLNESNSLYACLLTPQGKFFADFFIYQKSDYFLTDISAFRKEEIVRKLNMYKLRSSINITFCPEYKIFYFTEDFKTDAILFKDPRKEGFGFRAYLLEEELSNFKNNQELYDRLRIDNFIAEGDKDLVPEESFILEYGLDKLNAVDFKKGCYVGQELVARTHYRGIIRKEIVQIQSMSSLPKTREVIHSGEKKLGMLCSSVDNKGLGLIRTQEIKTLDKNDAIFIGEQKVTLTFQREKNYD